MKDLKIKSITNIPVGFTVYNMIDDEFYEDIDPDWAYLLALVDGEGQVDDYIVPYSVDQFGVGMVVPLARLIAIKHCPKCGAKMKLKYKVSNNPAEHYCNCKTENIHIKKNQERRNKIMIKDGKAFTKNDENYFEDLSKEKQDEICQWIKDNFIQRKTPLHGRTSYGLKHILTANIGLYLTNNEFKGAMLKCGFNPVDDTEQNWTYCISKKSPVFDLWRQRSCKFRE